MTLSFQRTVFVLSILAGSIFATAHDNGLYHADAYHGLDRVYLPDGAYYAAFHSHKYQTVGHPVRYAQVSGYAHYGMPYQEDYANYATPTYTPYQKSYSYYNPSFQNDYSYYKTNPYALYEPASAVSYAAPTAVPCAWKWPDGVAGGTRCNEWYYSPYEGYNVPKYASPSVPSPVEDYGKGHGATTYPEITAGTYATAGQEALQSATLKEFKVTLTHSGGYSPNYFQARLGDTVRFDATIDFPSHFHGITIDEFGVNQAVSSTDPDAPSVIQFVASKAGDFRIYCGTCGVIHAQDGGADFEARLEVVR
ncbi:hypothetical protein HY095_00990 [Candidatus Micrarchaeota archaeon]|nr:hypothetical protein [Candidatus Micrarchaeota archaeon]